MAAPLLSGEDVDFQSQNLDNHGLEGEISVPIETAEQEDGGEFNTLDEPVKDTIMRDVRAVGVKFFHVFIPRKSDSLLKEWDLWGPLILCVFLSMFLQGHGGISGSDGGPQFAEVFIIYWVGATVVTLNIKLLGGSISFFQSICVLGYCVVPLATALIACRLILLLSHSTFSFAIRFIAVMAGFAWSTFASTAFLSGSQPKGRRALAIYPIFLFYAVISWLILSHSH